MKKVPSKQYYVDNEALIEIGNKIRVARQLQNKTIEYLANSSEIDYTQLSRMELGKVNFSISYLIRIAKALNLSPKDLI